MSWFKFKKSPVAGGGTGVSDMAFMPFQTLPSRSPYLGPQWNVKRSMQPFSAPGVMLLNQLTMPNTLKGNGLAIPGQYALSPLAKQKGN